MLLAFATGDAWFDPKSPVEVRLGQNTTALQTTTPKSPRQWVLAAGFAPSVAYAQEPECPEGTLLEPYQNVCAAINDVRHEFIPSLNLSAGALMSTSTDDIQGPDQEMFGVTDPTILDEEPPEPGTIAIGVRYLTGSHSVSTSAHLHTRMFVYPEGLGPESLPNWLYTVATNHVDMSVEVVGMYRSRNWTDTRGFLGLFGRPCSVEFPCPNGSTGNSWQFYRLMDELTCNITHEVDSGGHPHLMIHYANHSDRLDDGDPPLWRNTVYLWNYCSARWDLIWAHEYRQNKLPCGVAGACFWGPAFEIFGNELYPPIRELGFEQSLLIHDGTRSELRPSDGADYMMPETIPHLVPWETLHLDPNRGFGVGNFVVENSAPEIQGQNPVQTFENEALELGVDDLQIFDPDVNPAYHVAFTLTAYEGENFVLDGLTVQPAEDFCGQLSVPVTVSDGAADSAIFQLRVDVFPENGDLNNDGDIDGEDLFGLTEEFGSACGSSCRADFNDDGMVDTEDLFIFVMGFGKVLKNPTI
jgi:hypothetical protein